MYFTVDPSSDKEVMASSIKGQCLAKKKTKSNLKSRSNLIIDHKKYAYAHKGKNCSKQVVNSTSTQQF
jgi:hypothetical protein